jgi:predicted nucleic acid-binding protein
VVESVVADTTYLIALERIGKIDLLPKLFLSIIIPPEVAREFKTPPEWLTVKSSSNVSVLASLKSQVDDGEAAAIALAHELNLKVILDDKAGRSAAKQFGLFVLGTIGLLVMAKKRGLILTVRPLVEDLEQYGFYLTEALKQEVLRLADE